MSRRAVLALLTWVGASCGPAPEPPRFQSLLEVPATLRAEPAAQVPLDGDPLDGAPPRLNAERGVLEFERTVPAAAWTRAGPGRWACPRPPGFQPVEYELRQGERTLTNTVLHERLVVADSGWSEAPTDVRLVFRVARSAVGEHGGELLALWPGEALHFRLDVPSEAALRFRLLVLGTGLGRASEGTLTVEQDGLIRATLALRSGDGSLEAPRSVELLPTRSSHLVLRLAGEALVWLVSPVVGPQ